MFLHVCRFPSLSHGKRYGGPVLLDVGRLGLMVGHTPVTRWAIWLVPELVAAGTFPILARVRMAAQLAQRPKPFCVNIASRAMLRVARKPFYAAEQLLCTPLWGKLIPRERPGSRRDMPGKTGSLLPLNLHQCCPILPVYDTMYVLIRWHYRYYNIYNAIMAICHVTVCSHYWESVSA